MEKILEVFKDKEIHIDPALQAAFSAHVIARHPEPVEGPKQSQFEDLRRELLSRKYSYKTVKGYIYFNRDLLRFAEKQPADINDNDIKDYLFYLAEEKEAATSTINQAINALKFYYGTMLKKKFMYEVKRPRKDKKLPVVGCWSDITYHIRENEIAKNNSKIFPNDYLKSMLLDLKHFVHPL